MKNEKGDCIESVLAVVITFCISMFLFVFVISIKGAGSRLDTEKLYPIDSNVKIRNSTFTNAIVKSISTDFVTVLILEKNTNYTVNVSTNLLEK